MDMLPTCPHPGGNSMVSLPYPSWLIYFVIIHNSLVLLQPYAITKASLRNVIPQNPWVFTANDILTSTYCWISHSAKRKITSNWNGSVAMLIKILGPQWMTSYCRNYPETRYSTFGVQWLIWLPWPWCHPNRMLVFVFQLPSHPQNYKSFQLRNLRYLVFYYYSDLYSQPP